MTEPEMVEYQDGMKAWFLDGAFHRTDGPAVEHAGRREWWQHNQRHRADGPAVEYPDGRKQWWIHGQRQPDQHVEEWADA